MIHLRSMHLLLALSLLISTGCVFSLGGSGTRGMPGMTHSMDTSTSIPGRPDYFPGDGPPIMVAPWENDPPGAIAVIGVGYTRLEDELGESEARTAALDDAMSRATTMMNGATVNLIELRSYAAMSDTHLGVKMQYIIQQ